MRYDIEPWRDTLQVCLKEHVINAGSQEYSPYNKYMNKGKLERFGWRLQRRDSNEQYITNYIRNKRYVSHV